MYNFFFFAQTRCERDPFHRDCYQDVDLESLFPDSFNSGGEDLILSLSPELAMLVTYFIKFLIFHLVGLSLCWISTIKFRS